MESQRRRNEELVRQFYEVMCDDTDQMSSYLADDCVFNNGEIMGAGEWIEQLHTDWIEPFPDFRLDILDLFSVEDIVVVRWQYKGTHTGREVHGVLPTCTEVEGTGISIYRVEDDEIVEGWIEYDTNAALRALDIIPDSWQELQIQTELLGVLLRVLRHNLRNDITAIAAYAEMIASEDVSDPEFGDEILDQAERLHRISEKTRFIENYVVNDDWEGAVDLVEITAGVVRAHRQTHPDAEIGLTILGSLEPIVTNRRILEFVLHEAIENAIIHSDRENPTVDVSIKQLTSEEHEAIIFVADDGPGIPDIELRPLRHRRENPLTHGSGIGLWAMKWGVDRIQGEIEFDTDTTAGTIISLYLG